MRQKRGSFTTWLCSLMPGAAEMYMGFMKCGISLMTVFILCLVIPSVLRLSDVFILFGVLTWFYSFFHARNLASSSEEEFMSLQDTYIWAELTGGSGIRVTNPTLRKWGAVLLILYGFTQLWDAVLQWIYYLIPEYLWETVSGFAGEVPRIVTALVIIVIGLKLIAGKKEEVHGEGE